MDMGKSVLVPLSPVAPGETRPEHGGPWYEAPG